MRLWFRGHVLREISAWGNLHLDNPVYHSSRDKTMCTECTCSLDLFIQHCVEIDL